MRQNDTRSPISHARIEQHADVLRELQQFLDATRRGLDEQIREYPTPIPRCDAQFNHLYEQRACAVRELEALRSASTPERALRDVAREALQHAPYGDSDLEQRLRARLQAFRC